MTSDVVCNYGRHAACNVEEICALLMSNNSAGSSGPWRLGRLAGCSRRLSNILHSLPRVASLMHCPVLARQQRQLSSAFLDVQ